MGNIYELLLTCRKMNKSTNLFLTSQSFCVSEKCISFTMCMSKLLLNWKFNGLQLNGSLKIKHWNFSVNKFVMLIQVLSTLFFLLK
jgi:hypothetical protein